MIEIARILCPVDLSAPSRRALDYAVAVSRWYGASITVLRVIPAAVPVVTYAGALFPQPAVTPPADLERVRLATAEFAAREQGGPPMETAVAEGDAASVIATYAQDLGADLVVMGTRGSHGLDRLLLGSVTERVLRTVACPVLTVPPAAPDAVPARPGLFTHIVCGVDFSPASLHALRFATAIADEADAHLTVVHAVEHQPLWPLPAAPRDAASLNAVAAAEARRKLLEVIGDEAREYAAIEEAVVPGKAHEVILARAAAADLIVIGAHGGAAGLLSFGSTTTHIVRDATCAVLTVR